MILNFLGFIYFICALYTSIRHHLFKYLLVATMLIDIFSQAYGIQIIALRLGSLTLYISDIPIILMVFFLLRTGRIYKSKIALAWTICFLMICCSAIRGLLEHGLNLYYLSDIRTYLSLAIPIIYFYVVPQEFDDKFWRFLNHAFILITVYCYIAWGIYASTGISLAFTEDAGGLRVIGSNGAFYLSAYTLILIYKYFYVRKNKKIFIQIISQILAIIILQHNSVWAAFAIGYFSLLIFVKKENELIKNGKFNLWLLTFCAVVVFAIVFILFSNSTIISNLISTFDKFAQTNTGEGTIGDRQKIWSAYINSLNAIEWIIGKSMGSGWFVYAIHGMSQAPTHNAYIQGLMRIGLIGDIALFGLLISVSIKAYNRKKYASFAIMFSSFVYMYAYMFSLELSCIWGIIIGLLSGNIHYKINTGRSK